ncbi:aldo/keto reductase [Candidatus Acetatifactor stercoripullorum]|uniref:aldo/keto reductase n=1 Tax=Candidatus Acetatifactor stercoripullorum TaxID=2838414 RepID=UPI002ED500D0
MSKMETVKLNNGVEMPLEGFGVFQISDAAQCEQVVYDAIKTGYRLLDTAAAYMNEEAVGKGVSRAIADGIVNREELFITTKVWVQDQKNEETAYNAVKTSLEKLNMPYVDLVLLHQPMGDYFAAYRGIEKAYKDGLVRAIGVANFYPAVLSNLCENVEMIPAVNQVELHPFFTQEAAIENMKAYGVVPQAWGPLAEGKHGIFTDAELVEIGKKYGKSAAQVVLRWNVQRGVSIIPKSVHVERMEQNIDIWDFALTDEEMAKIASKDLGHSEIVNHDDPAFVKMLCGMKIHE